MFDVLIEAIAVALTLKARLRAQLLQLEVVAHLCNPSVREAENGGLGAGGGHCLGP